MLMWKSLVSAVKMANVDAIIAWFFGDGGVAAVQDAGTEPGGPDANRCL